MMIHDFDVARWMLGEEVETVQAAGSVLTDPEIGNRGDFDSANAILRTASGTHGSAKAGPRPNAAATGPWAGNGLQGRTGGAAKRSSRWRATERQSDMA